MVNILIFIPNMEMRKTIEQVIESMPKYEDIKIEMIYVYGTPESLAENKDAEILIARGMTYQKLQDSFPHKHIVQIRFSSFDILDALVKCREMHHAKRIALCIHKHEFNSIPVLEELCDADIDIYDVNDESSARQAIEKAQSKGADVYVGADTTCGICDKMGLTRVRIHTKFEAIESALVEAINAACTINYERAKASMLTTMMNSITDVAVIVDKNGNILSLNNQAYRMFGLSTSADFVGFPIERMCKELNWRDVIDKKTNNQEVLQINEKNYLVGYKPILVDQIEAGVVITIKNTEVVIKEELKIRRSLSDKGLTAKYSFEDMIGSSQNMLESIAMAKRYSGVNSNVLIIGETGTGKELFAHSIHKASSRCNQPFVALNCAALPENLLESELFGYEPGAFSGASKNGKIGLFELAHGGTIFMDEIGEIPCSLQAKLLRVLQEKEVRRIGSDSIHPIDVRVISATNINIEKEVGEGKFRSDLYYRLNLLDIFIPPLRERGRDILKIADFYFAKLACEMGKPIPSMSKDAAGMLMEYSWPGNVRELRNICERLIVLNDTDYIDGELMQHLKIFKAGAPVRIRKEPESFEMDEIYENLQEKKKKKDIASELGVSRTTLWRMAKKQQELERQKPGRPQDTR